MGKFSKKPKKKCKRECCKPKPDAPQRSVFSSLPDYRPEVKEGFDGQSAATNYIETYMNLTPPNAGDRLKRAIDGGS